MFIVVYITCSDDLLKEVLLFLASWSNHEPAAMKCLTLLRRTVQTGSRLYPPHFVEFAAATVGLVRISSWLLSTTQHMCFIGSKIYDTENEIGKGSIFSLQKWCETILHKVTFPDMSSMVSYIIVNRI